MLESTRQLLDDYARLLQNAAASPGELRDAVNELADRFGALTSSIDDADDTTPPAAGRALPYGKAIAPDDAARCMRDYLRTVRFHRGIGRGLDTLLRTHDARPIHVLYAGCGPFATLAAPLMRVFAAGDVQFHLWEAHERSLSLCRTLIERLELDEHVAEYRLGDASIVDGPPAFPVHMLVIEAMQATLAKEPQVGLTAHLAPWLEPDGILVPGRIRVVATMLDPNREFGPAGAVPERVREDLGVVFELDRERAGDIDRRLRAHADDDEVLLPVVRIRIPDDAPSSLQLWLRTHVRVFGPEELGDYDSGLTMPRPAPLAAAPARRAEISAQYVIGRAPGIRYEVIETTRVDRAFEGIVALRPEGPGDEPFLRQLYASTREGEPLFQVLPPEQHEPFLRMQFDARRQSYAAQFPDASYDLITADNEPIGRLCVDRSGPEVCVVDIALLPAWRDRGIGASLMRSLMQEDNAIILHVESENHDAKRFYERLGFRSTGMAGAHWRLVYDPVDSDSREIADRT